MYFAAFMDLTTERSFGFGEGPIPWSAVRQYCRDGDIVGDQLADMHYHVGKLDSVYLEYRAKQAKKPTQPNGGKSDGSRIVRPENAAAGARIRAERRPPHT